MRCVSSEADYVVFSQSGGRFRSVRQTFLERAEPLAVGGYVNVGGRPASRQAFMASRSSPVSRSWMSSSFQPSASNRS